MKKKYDGEKITLKLPKGMKSSELKWLSVWCKEFKVDFASIKFKNKVEMARLNSTGNMNHIDLFFSFKVNSNIEMLISSS